MSEPDYSEDDFKKGYGSSWMRALGEEPPDAPPARPARTLASGKPASLADWAGEAKDRPAPDEREQQRLADIFALEQLLKEEDLWSGEQTAFEEMHEKLQRGRYPLTEKQRAWVHRTAERMGVDIDPRSPAERNATVPRGREVATPAPLQNLPKQPPGGRRFVVGSQKPLPGLVCEVEGCGVLVYPSPSGGVCSKGHGGVRGKPVEGMLVCERDGCGATVWGLAGSKRCSNGHTGITGRKP